MACHDSGISVSLYNPGVYGRAADLFPCKYEANMNHLDENFLYTFSNLQEALFHTDQETFFPLGNSHTDFFYLPIFLTSQPSQELWFCACLLSNVFSD